MNEEFIGRSKERIVVNVQVEASEKWCAPVVFLGTGSLQHHYQ